MVNKVDLDQTLRAEVNVLGLYCLSNPILPNIYGNSNVNDLKTGLAPDKVLC